MSDQLLPPCHIVLELDFHKFKFYVELKFYELEFQNSGKLLNISQIVLEHKLFQPKMVFGHFCLKNWLFIYFSSFRLNDVFSF